MLTFIAIRVACVFRSFLFLVLGIAALRLTARAAAPPAPNTPDVLLFTDGEKLIGHLVRSTGSSVVFQSDMAGQITVDWSKIKELHAAGEFAVVEKGAKLGWHKNDSNIPQGTISMTNQIIQLQAPAQASPVAIPVSDTSDVIDEATFKKAVLQRPGLFEDWKGSATLGIALVTATQDSRSYSSSLSLVRALPTESWMNPSSRTSLTFTSAYGQVTQPGTPLVKTSLFHADAERDQYFTPSVYTFADAGFDHDYSQGLDLQQSYGGGIGWTTLKRPNQELDLKGEMTFVSQQFFSAAQNQKLLGSIFSEGYNRTFTHKIVFHEDLAINPAWTVTKAYSANGTASVAMPVFKRISFTLSAQDTFLNDPSPGYRKNSFELTTGLTYTLPQ